MLSILTLGIIDVAHGQTNSSISCDNHSPSDCELQFSCVFKECIPSLPQGTKCSYSNQCDRNSTCGFASSIAVNRTCIPRFENGTKCMYDFQCKDGLSCSHGESTRTCTALKREGEKCWSDSECEGNSVCFYVDESAVSICKRKIPEGSSCPETSWDTLCQSQLVCLAGPDSNFNSTCQSLFSLGTNCTEDWQCKSRRCVTSETQPGLKSCVSPTGGDLECFSASDCGEDKACESGICTTQPLALNETCFSAKDCPWPLMCRDDVPGEEVKKCLPKLNEGDSCRGSECKHGLSCYKKICRPLGKIGNECESFADCDDSMPEKLTCDKSYCQIAIIM